MDSTGVLIVGAGPTGLVMACALARHGLRPRIVDQRTEPAPDSRALTVQARSLEILESLGVVERFLERGRRIDHMEMISGNSRLARFSLDELDSPFPFTLVLSQRETERILEDELQQRYSLTVERGVELRSFVADAGGVVSRLADSDGNRLQIDSQFLVGCDGADSTVRKILGVAWDPLELPGSFALADARLEVDLPTDQGTVFFAADGALGLMPLPEPGWWRVVASFEAGGEVPPVDAALLVALAAARAPHIALRVEALGWTAHYEVCQRKVAQYRRDRVMLAGDAAHTYSPISGQGLNLGIQDAWNLAWKLACVRRGHAPASLLDSYDLEREPVARKLLEGTARSTRMVTLRSPLSRALRNQVARFLGNLDIVQQRMARALGETSVQYRQSPIVAEDAMTLARATFRRADGSEDATIGDWREFHAAPRAGDRIPDIYFGPADAKLRLHQLIADTRHTLLLFDGHAATSSGYLNLAEIARATTAHFGHLVRVHIVVPGDAMPDALDWRESVVFDPEPELHERFGAGAECLYVLRPDGYVGYRAQPARADTLSAWLDRVFLRAAAGTP